MAETSGRPMAARGAAWRRRQRRLRSMLRHERQTVRMELAAALHHSWGGGLETYEGLRTQKTASAGPAEYFEISSDDGGLAGAAAAGEDGAAHWGRVRVGPSTRGPCAADGRTAAQCPPVLRHFLAVRCRAGYRSAEDLPGLDRLRSAWGTICATRRWWNSWCMCRLSCLILRSSSLLPSIPVPGGDGGGGRGGLQGSLPRQNSAALHVEQTVDIPVPGRAGEGGRGGLQGFAGQSSTASSSHVGAADGAGQGVFSHFSPGEKVRSEVRTRGRNWVRTLIHPSTLSAHQMPPEQLVDMPVPREVFQKSASRGPPQAAGGGGGSQVAGAERPSG